MKSMRLGYLIRVLLAVLLVTASPGAWAVLCSDVFFKGADGDGLNAGVPLLTLPDFTATQSLVAESPRAVPVSNSYWTGGTAANGWILTAPTTGTARVFVKGDLTISNNAEINKGGKPQNLIIVVVGNLDIQNSSNTKLNALVYVTGNVTIGNNPAIAGGISAVGSLVQGNNVVYDSSAIPATDFGTLCDNPASVGQINHFRFLHATSGLTCNPLDVTLQACADATCSRFYEGSISITLSPSSWAGGNSRAFSGGQTLLKLYGNSPGYLTLGMSAALPAANGALQCRTSSTGSTTDCRVYFADSGFVFDVPNLLAGKTQTGITLQAVRKDATSQLCVPAFGPATRTLQFWSDYVDPGTGSLSVQVNGGAVSASAAAPTSLNLTFDNTATTVLNVQYADAGLMRLNAQYVGSGVESGLVMLGSDQFVSKPYGLHITTPADATCTAASLVGCSVLRMAGASFPLNVRAVAWQADGEALTEAALRDNPSTPNFRLNGIALSSSLVAPAAAVGGVAGTFYRHAADGSRSALASYDHALGTTTSLDVSQAEVGIFRLSATPVAGSYFGQSVSGGESALIGRFTPAYLGVTSTASLTPACGAFSYQGQTISFAGGQPGIAVTGYNRQGEVTRNYDRDPFWRLAPPQRQSYSLSSAASKPSLASRLQSLGNAQSLAVADSGAADGSRAFNWPTGTGRQADALLWQLPSPPTAEDLPFVLTAGGEHVQLNVHAGQLTDLDGVCYRGSAGSAASCQNFSHAVGGTEVRLGRLRIDAASGPENQGLDLPYWLESWQTSTGGAVFGTTTGDSCSLSALGQVVLSNFTGDLQASHFPTPPGTLGAATGTPTPTGVIRLPAPNHKGSALVSLSGLNGATPALPWLLFDWDGNGTPEAPSARATFGVFSGQRALIFRRELYR
ncbi:DUF6701 domain-containing protein [Pseudomonas sp. GCM10022188]|uniref:DUF6701 domain-containing protein n=1 Tax=Pseudomonas TaxID=286 RepID=UPI001E349C92|nr:DUF6701 domain-containing protein [Pseudomonas oryzagri]MCC6077598.1 hypothetical protein [Pseudomonas oryzagri]